ncbi:integrin alpha-M isoform X9 [Panthera uncia]|uniref:integrin alpha-M isoform X9 n=1 Tax=Panthera uncia TaxID=29064 RepID=UPI0020FFC2C5|nr:integrin alpha-M isoform X9 [Panthera uncia]
MTHRVLLLTGFLLLPALALLCHGFNLDTKHATLFQENAAGFGQSVVQLEGSRLVVGAPQEIKAANKTGGLYQCDYSTGKCEPISLEVPLEAVNMSLGLSLAFATNPFRLLACGPTVHQTCKENTYVNGLCFLFGSNLRQQPQSFPESLRECPRQDSDIAFLIDGSGSIIQSDFQKMKDFVSTVMGQFKKSKTLFSLMQYSEEFQTHFTFNQFKKNPNPSLLVRPINQLRGRTHTATGIRKVVRELFQSSSGAREKAFKILVVITDGEKFGDPLEYKDVIPEADKEGIIRYVIGVGAAFNSPKTREELNTIASKPPRDHVFRVNNFEALKTIQNQLQEKIFAIEGTQTGSTSSFEHEMSQEGFSAAITSRIEGSQLSPTLQYFGQSLSGGQDLTMDGLVDLAIGAQGHVLLLRSQPVLRLEVTMEFTPKEVARNVFECRAKVVKGQTAGEVRVCLHVRKNTRDRLREGEIQSNITYDLALDPTLPHPRVVFDETKNSTRRQTRILRLNQECETLKLLLPYCVEDSVNPIILHFNFSLVGKPLSLFGNLQPVLAVDAQRLFTALFPFEQNCGSDNICHDDLSITFTFMGLDTLVVGGPRDLNVTVTVRNQGEDSYRTQVTFFYPPGLSYRRKSVTQKQRSQRPWRLTCESEDSTNGPEALKNSSCNISHPIFPNYSEITFNITFGVESDAFFGNRLLLKANVTSENNTTKTNKTEFQLELPVKYTVFVVVTSHEVSTKYLNFIASEKTSHIIKHQYEVNNLGQRSLPISVVFWVPIKLNQVAVWDNLQVTLSQNLSRTCNTTEKSPPLSDFMAELKRAPVVNCSIAVCQRIQCDISSFSIQEKVNITLQGKLSFDWYIKTSANYLQIVTTAEVLYDDSKFALLPGQETFLRAQIETKVEPNEVHNPVPLIVGSSVGGLVLLALITAGLYKVSPLPVCSPLSSLLLTQQLIIGFNSHQVTESQFLQL